MSMDVAYVLREYEYGCAYVLRENEYGCAFVHVCATSAPMYVRTLALASSKFHSLIVPFVLTRAPGLEGGGRGR